MTGLYPNARHVATREYAVRVRGRAYLITTALLIVAVVGVALLPTVLRAAGVESEAARIAIDVRADDLGTDPVTLVAGVLASIDPDGADPEVTLAEDSREAAADVETGELDGLLTLTRDDAGDLRFELLTDDGARSVTRVVIEQAATALAISDRLERAGFSQSETAALFQPPEFAVTSTGPAERDEAELGQASLAAYIVVVLTFMAIITYGNWIAQSVAEEKSNRVMELLISAATPLQLLTGKVLGTAAAGLTQYVAVVVAALAGLAAAEPIGRVLGVDGAPLELPSVEPWMLLAFAAFFLLGFLLYATLYAAAGSLVSRVEDVQQAVGVLMFLAIGGYFVSFIALNDADAGWVGRLSLVPFFSPYLMPARLLLTTVPATEIAAAVGILAVSLAIGTWLAARVYSAGVLMYGQRPGIRTLLRAARISR